ncbi:hypothetical protein PV760_13765 [Paenarthrobacter sp. CC6]|uniref:hypothetical protein n=1 Tax=Paenarthrobacter sp. CC6 TaxID=3029184 RepID=UPI00339BB5DC
MQKPSHQGELTRGPWRFFASTVTSGALLIAIPLAMAAGLSPSWPSPEASVFGIPFVAAVLNRRCISSALALVRRHIRIVSVRDPSSSVSGWSPEWGQ